MNPGLSIPRAAAPALLLGLCALLPLETGGQTGLPLVSETETAAPLPSIPLSRTGAGATSSTSQSRQFVVHGASLRHRSSLAARCDEVAAQLNRLLRATEPWVHPVVVRIQPVPPAALTAASPGITHSISELEGGGFHLQLNIPDRSGLRPADFHRELVHLLLAERVLRTHRQVTSHRSPLVPDWVVTGVCEAMEFKSRARPSAVFAALFKSGKIYGVEEVLGAAPGSLDGLSKTIYQSSCCALVLTLLDQPEGSRLFGRFMASLASDGRPERELLAQWYPAVAASDASLNKWWSLQLATLSAPGVAETLDPVATAELLDKAITFQLPSTLEGLPQPRSVLSIASQRPAAPALALPEPPLALQREPSDGKPAAPAPANAQAATTKPVPKAKKPAPANPAADAEADVEDGMEESDRPGFLRRMLSFGRSRDDSDEDSADAPPQKESPRSGSDAAEDDSTGMSRSERRRIEAEEKEARKQEEAMLAAEAKAAREKAAEEKRKLDEQRRAEAKTESEAKRAKPAEKPKTEDSPPAAKKPEDPESPDRKGGVPLNPLRWFRGKKPDDGDGGGAPPSAFLPPESPFDWVRAPHLSQPLSNFTSAGDRVAAILNGGPGRLVQASVNITEPDAPQETEPEIPALTRPPAIPEPANRIAPSPMTAFPIEDYAVILTRPNRSDLLRQAQLRLQEVGLRGNVLFRDIAKKYSATITDIAAGKTKDLDQRLTALRAEAVETLARAVAVRDHLDWVEATQSRELSGMFDDFIGLPAVIAQEVPHRQDPLARLLDEIEAEN